MSILDLLGLAADEAQPGPALAGSRAVREIIRELQAMEPGQARYLAAFAYILSRVARADLDISATETRAMEERVMSFGHLAAERAHLVVEIAKNQASLFGMTQDFVVTREFKEISAANDVLGDEKKRKAYDEFGEAALHSGFAFAYPELGPALADLVGPEQARPG